MSLIMATVVFVCTMSVVLSVISSNLRQAVVAEHQRLQSLSSIFRAVLSDPVAQQDEAGAREALRALKDIPTIKQASVRTVDGALLTEMGSGAVLDRKVIHSDKFTLTDLWFKDTLQIGNDIVKGGKTVGSLRLTADISWLASQFRTQLAAAFAAAGIAILVAFAGGTLLIQRATRQLSNLANDLSGIGTQKDLTVKISRESDDEVGVLVDAFNDMMHRIDERDRALRKHSDTLEAKVQERTRELVVARDEAESANAAKSEFLAMMSHEIRTPMNGMMVMAQMLAAAPLAPRHLRFAEIINRSGQNLLAIINDVLDISKIEAGRLTLETAPFKIDDILADVHGLFYENARERGITLTYRVGTEVPDELSGDSARLNQVVTNLVNNALKFTERGAVTVTVTANSAPKGCALTIAVKDTGIGIAADKIGQVFDRFVQADQSITRRFGGTGLGLAISHNLVAAMGGTINVTSREGVGSTFTVVVPLEGQLNSASNTLAGSTFALDMDDLHERTQIENALSSIGAKVNCLEKTEECESGSILLSTDAGRISRSDTTALLLEPVIDSIETGILNRNRLVLKYPLTRSELHRLENAVQSGDFAPFRALRRSFEMVQSYAAYRGLHALAVDDNKVNRDVLCEVLYSLGMTVDIACNGEEAILAASAHRFDIIFMDCSMPVMDGFAATRIIRERETGSGHRTPIVAITALGNQNRNQDWLEAGMDAWIAKPFTIPTVTNAISRLALKADGNEPMTAESSFDARFAAVPEVDEQTIGMIVRLSAQGDSHQSAKIFSLFQSSGWQTIERIKGDLNSKSEESPRRKEVLAEASALLASMATSIGAARLAAMAQDISAKAKSGADLSYPDIETLAATFEKSVTAVSGRLSLSANHSSISAA